MTVELQEWTRRAFANPRVMKPAAVAVCDDREIAGRRDEIQLLGEWWVPGGSPREQEVWIELQTGQVLLLWLGLSDNVPVPEPLDGPRLVLESAS